MIKYMILQYYSYEGFEGPRFFDDEEIALELFELLVGFEDPEYLREATLEELKELNAYKLYFTGHGHSGAWLGIFDMSKLESEEPTWRDA